MLWIITQDQKAVVSVKEVRVIGNQIEGIVDRRFFIFWNKELGEYKSNERAAEVLNEICGHLEKNSTGSATFSMPEQ